MIFLDTNIAIALRDLDRATHERVQVLGDEPVISMITRIELENGVNAERAAVNSRRKLLDALLAQLNVQMFTRADILTYGTIIHSHGYDRRRTLDRLIAAQAISRDAALVTRNGKDFRSIDNLKLIEW